MAENKEIIYGIKIKTGDSESQILSVKEALEGVEDAIRNVSKASASDAAAEQFEKLNKIVDESVLSIQELGTAADNYKNIALAAGKESPIGQAAIQKAAELEKQMDETQQSVANLAQKGQSLNAALQLSSSVIAGYTAFQSIQQLIGDENEDLLKDIAKLQAATSLLAAVEQIRLSLQKETILAQKLSAVGTRLLAIQQAFLAKTTLAAASATTALRAAIIATGIGAVIVAVASLVAYWDEITAALGGATKAQKLYNDAVDESAASIAEETVKLDRLLDVAKDESKSREERQNALNEIQDTYPGYLDNIDLETINSEKATKAVEKLTAAIESKARIQALNNVLTEEFEKQIKLETKGLEETTEWWHKVIGAGTNAIVQKQFSIEMFKREKGAIEENIETIKNLIKAEEDLTDASKVESAERMLARIVEAEEVAATGRKESAKKREERRKQAEADRKALAQEWALYEKFLEDNKKAAEKARLDRIKKAVDDANLLDDFLRMKEDAKIELTADRFERERMLVEQEFEDKLAKLEEEGLLTTEMEMAILADRNEKLKAIDQDYIDWQKDQDEKETDGKIENWDRFAKFATASIDTVSGLTAAAYNMEIKAAAGNEVLLERIRKKQFQAEKVLNIAQGVVNGIGAVIRAYREGGPIAAIATGLAVAAQLAKMASTQYKSAGTSGVAAVDTNTQTSSGVQPNAFAAGGSFNQGSTLNPNNDGGNNSPFQKVIVVGSEIEAQLNQDKKAELAATI